MAIKKSGAPRPLCPGQMTNKSIRKPSASEAAWLGLSEIILILLASRRWTSSGRPGMASTRWTCVASAVPTSIRVSNIMFNWQISVRQCDAGRSLCSDHERGEKIDVSIDNQRCAGSTGPSRLRGRPGTGCAGFQNSSAQSVSPHPEQMLGLQRFEPGRTSGVQLSPQWPSTWSWSP